MAKAFLALAAILVACAAGDGGRTDYLVSDRVEGEFRVCRYRSGFIISKARTARCARTITLPGFDP